jgi:hypothetical protein
MRLILILCLSFSSVAMASTGGWVIGGADQFGNKLNPWFMMAPEKVKYCIKVDTKTFTASEEVVSEIVNLAIEYWRLDFITLRKLTNPNWEVGKQSSIANPEIALQGYEQVSCDENPEMRFLFGEGTLSREEKTFFGNRDFFAQSVRTDYDPKTLKSRGFIYVHSDKSWSWRPWGVFGFLYRILVHEVGHVFGLQHSENGIMMADYPERVINRALIPLVNGPLSYLFTGPLTLPSYLLPTVRNVKLSDGEIASKSYGISVVFDPSTYPIGEATSSKKLVDGVTMEWHTISPTESGEKVPTITRISPFLYERYQLIDNKIVCTARSETQCSKSSCFIEDPLQIKDVD